MFAEDTDAVLVIEGGRRITEINEPARRLLELNIDHVPPIDLNAIFEVSPQYPRLMRLLESPAGPIEMPLRLERSGGRLLEYRLNIRTRRTPDGLISVVVLHRVDEGQQIEPALPDGDALLRLISRTQARFISEAKPLALFEEFLEDVLQLTLSEYGFIGEVHFDLDGTPYMRTRAISPIAWDEQTQQLYDENRERGMEFRNLRTLFGEVLRTGKPFISNQPAADPHRGGLPEGHPPLMAFAGMPLMLANRMIGMIGIANRPGGYDRRLLEWLDPALGICAQIIEGYRNIQRRKDAEQSLRDSEARLRALVETAADGIITIDAGGTVESMNPAAENIFGYRAREVIGHNISMLMPSPDREHHQNYIETHMTTGKRSVIGLGRVVRGLRKNGEMFSLYLSVGEMTVGGQRMFTGILRDITDVRRSEEALRKRDRLLQGVSDANRALLTNANFHDAIHHSLRLLGQAAQVDRVFIFRHRAAHGEAFATIGIEFEWVSSNEASRIEDDELHRIDYRELKVPWYDTLSSGQPVTGLTRSLPHPDRGLFENSRIRSFAIVPIRTDGNLWGLVGLGDCCNERAWSDTECSTLQTMADSIGGAIVRRHTDERLMEVQHELMLSNVDLYQSARRNELILRGIGDGVIATDIEDRVTLINEVACHMLGLESAPAGSEALTDLFKGWSPQDGTLSEKLGRVGDPTPTDFIIDHDGREPINLMVSINRYQGESGEISGRVLILRDVTREREIDRIKTDIISSVSHELRTPLTSIKGFTATMRSDSEMPSETMSRFLGIIDEEADRLADLIDDLLEISRLESGRTMLNLRRLRVNTVLRRTLDMMRPSLAEKGLDLQLQLAPELPAIIGDDQALHRILINLLSNAIKFTPQGGTIRIETRHDTQYIRLEVTDTGMGIPEKDLPHIFERFYRVPRPKWEIPGTGLGLSIVSELVQRLGGTIEVTSTMDLGSTFALCFPIANAGLADAGLEPES